MTDLRNTLFVEKYRPQTLDEIKGHDAVVRRLKKYADDPGVPHMLFAGPAGTGKTAVITAFAREVFGDSWGANLTELNASDERGIDTIRDKVKKVARSSPVGDVDYKIIFLDEADALTRSAQPALRRIMEDYSDVTRFFLSCNYPNKIIDPIQSRCTVFRFGRLNDDTVREIIGDVAEKEGIEIEDYAMEKLVQEARGDARSAINSLQSATIDGEVTEETIKTVVGVVDDQLVSDIVDLSFEGNFDEAMQRLDMELLKQGADTTILSEAFLRVIKRKDMPASGRAVAIDSLADVEYRTKEGANPNVQWHKLLTELNAAYHLDYNSYDR